MDLMKGLFRVTGGRVVFAGENPVTSWWLVRLKIHLLSRLSFQAGDTVKKSDTLL